MSFIHDQEHVETLRKSFEIVGPLQYVIIKEGSSHVLVGRHRVRAVPKWPFRTIKVEGPLQEELIIIHGQVQRGLEQQEAKMRVLRIAKIVEVDRGIRREKVCKYIIDNNLLPWTPRHIERLLPREYKMKTRPSKTDRHVSISSSNSLRPTKLSNERDSEDPRLPYPFPDCLCARCPNRDKCY